MGATTPIYALPYPVPADPADVPADMQALANRLDTVIPRAGELKYAVITANVSVSVVAETSAVPVVSAGAVTFDGSPVIVEFSAQSVQPGTAVNSAVLVTLWQDGGHLQRLSAVANNAAGTLILPMYARARITPTAGSHTYEIRAWAQGAAGTINAGSGGSGTAPAFIRISRA